MAVQKSAGQTVNFIFTVPYISLLPYIKKNLYFIFLKQKYIFFFYYDPFIWSNPLFKWVDIFIIQNDKNNETKYLIIEKTLNVLFIAPAQLDPSGFQCKTPFGFDSRFSFFLYLWALLLVNSDDILLRYMTSASLGYLQIIN